MKSSEAKSEAKSEVKSELKSESKSLKIQPADSSQKMARELSFGDLKILKAPFPRERLGVKVQSVSKDRNRAMLVLYLQHTDVQDRLEEVDPSWTTEVLNEERFDEQVYVRLRLTVKGVSRENVGEGSDPKGAYSDALKRCAMLFGVGRYLYDSETVWVDYNESRDRYRQWSIQDYDRVFKSDERPEIVQRNVGLKTNISPSEEPKGKAVEKKQTRPREQLNRILMNLYRPYLVRFPETQFVELLKSRYGVGETRLMAVEQIEDLVQYMEEQLRSVA